MKLRFSTFALAILSQTVLLAAPTAFAQGVAPQDQTAIQDDPSLARRAVEWSQDRLAELDASIVVLEKETARLQGDARAKADATVKVLREKRDAYRAKADEAAAKARSWTDAQVAEARKSLDENWTAFQTARDEYLASAKTDLATRRAILEAELDARQKAWQKSIDDLKADATKLAADQRAAIDARIIALKAQADEAKARAARLQDASAQAWETTKQSYADAQKLFFDTYASIRQSIEDAKK
ncbi:hypothetical protein [Azospirillum rugosum]|uniref:Septal ring factor EnvC (AmiA/AmiB activator) n=1 Tax=Azospirillum rugosum TaxID=416170 RepID=A0ABS4SY86_9PROT|nr:hypothetical protein [Azospirillum rugosum]MBP2297244.1 septal ring factor EnvC (AmiA/AmiB activator) [Azospirillum rugosum]MDQ0531086.1 septal ring factor EnvC (AmiA/AmiB activator) [Azospirillum rugosum]